MEAFIESYHAIQTHPQILSFTGGDNSSTTCLATT